MYMPSSSASDIRLLDSFPLIRSRSIEEAQQRVGDVFSRHRLQVQGRTKGLDLWHNRVTLGQSSLNVLHYGAEVDIDPGERGDFYLVQLPLTGCARITSGNHAVDVNENVLSVLQPRTPSRMRWSTDCTMLLLQTPSHVVQEYVGEGERPRMALSRRRGEPEVAAWCQAMLDMARNIDQFAAQWQAHPTATAAMEGFLLTAFSCLLHQPDAAAAPDAPVQARSLRRAKEYIHAHLDRPLTLADIARHACVSPRTLELVFKRHGEPTPLAYARQQRLQAAHVMLRSAARDGQAVGVTDVALAFGFVHMGRFSAQYRAQFGCLPSQTLKAA